MSRQTFQSSSYCPQNSLDAPINENAHRSTLPNPLIRVAALTESVSNAHVTADHIQTERYTFNTNPLHNHSRVVSGCSTSAVLAFTTLSLCRTWISGEMKEKLRRDAPSWWICAATWHARFGQFMRSHAVLLLTGALLLVLSLHLNVAKSGCSVVRPTVARLL
jgi:hypothetical protein